MQRKRKIGKNKMRNAKYLFSTPPSAASCVRIGRRQSMPSSNMDSCAGVSDTVPLAACGQMNLPRSNLFANKTQPVSVTTTIA